MYYNKYFSLNDSNYLYLCKLLEFYRDNVVKKVQALRKKFPYDYNKKKIFSDLRLEYFILNDLIVLFSDFKYLRG